MVAKNSRQDGPVEGEILDTPNNAAPVDYLPSEVEVARAQKDAEDKGKSMIVVGAQLIAAEMPTVKFRGRPLLLKSHPYPHYVPFHRDMFDPMAYRLLGGKTRSQLSDIYAYMSNMAEDLTDNGHLILFGVPMDKQTIDADTDIASLVKARPRVWDTRRLDWSVSAAAHADSIVWRAPYSPITDMKEPIPFVMSLAGGDQGLYDDIMQSLAPLVMEKKPDGVMWWVGDGANGKSTLMDAIYKIFPGQLASLTVKALMDGRDTPLLNATMANVVKESSEGRIEDTEIYKAIGTHENFRVHKFHSQDTTEVNGNSHHIFSANSIPTFNDKGFSARRRTFIIPFTQTFRSDPTFEERTFTPEMFGRLIAEMCRYAQRIRSQGYKFKWSATTLNAKIEYDTSANNAEEYAKAMIDDGLVAFDGFGQLRADYTNWCADNGYLPLGINNMRRAFGAYGFVRVSKNYDDSGKKVADKIYRLPIVTSRDLLIQFHMSKPGLYTVDGFQPEPTPEQKADVPDFETPKSAEPEPVKKSKLNGRW